MSEHQPSFQRFDQSSMDHIDYLASGPEEHEHARVVSVLSGIFNPVIAEFTSYLQSSDVAKFTENISLKTSITGYTYDKFGNHPDLFDLNNHPLKTISSQVISERYRDSSLPTQAPIGEYGESLATSLVASGDTLRILLDKSDTGQYSVLNLRYTKFLLDETFNFHITPILHEGIQSTIAGLSLLTIDQVEGYEDAPLSLCQAVIENNLLEEFASLVPNGYVFPMVLSGYAFSNPLENRDGKLSLSQELKHNLRVKHVEAQEAAFPGSRGRGCPAAVRTIPNEPGKISGVTLLGQSLLPVLAHEYAKLRHYS